MNLRTTPLTCDIKGCDCKPTKKIMLSLAVHDNHTPAISTPIAYVCDNHVNNITFDDFANAGDNWENICNQFVAIGRMKPKKEFSKLISQEL